MRPTVIPLCFIAAVAAEHLQKRGFSGKAVHELLGERDVTMNEVTNDYGIMAVERTAKNKPGTSIEEFAEFFVQVYKSS